MAANKKDQRVVVIGGGPAGAAVATGLSQQGFANVRVFEAYPEVYGKASPKAYVIALHRRGQEGLRAATDRSVIHSGVYSKKLVSHPKLKVAEREHAACLVPRQSLTSELLNAAREAGAVVEFEKELVDLDLPRSTATLEDRKTGRRTTVDFDLLVGCDGSNSKVRKLLQERAGLEVRVERDTMEYQVATLERNPFAEAGSAVHGWNDPASNSFSLGFPLKNGGLLVAPVFPEGNFGRFREASCGGTFSGYELVEKLFSDMPEDAMKPMLKQLSEGQPANGGLCIWSSSLACGNVALVGDSGHGMWPSLGQGANCALESVGVFCQAVRDVTPAAASGGDDKEWGRKVAAEYNARRYEDARAAVDLTFSGVGSRTSRHRGNSPAAYKVQVAGMLLLNKITLGVIPLPALFRIMKGDTAPYRTLRAYHFRYEKIICVGAVVSIFAVRSLVKAIRKF